MSAVEQVFFEALEDLRDGRGRPMQSYLERVPANDREQLADMLAAYFASQRSPSDPHADPEVFEQALATIDRVMSEASGPAGLLPDMLVELSRTRGMRRREIVDRLQENLAVPDRARGFLEQLYHRLESGSISGTGLSRRLLEALGDVFRMPEQELEVASIPIGPPKTLRPAQAFGRGPGGGFMKAVVPLPGEPPPDELELREVYQLFFGGREG